MAISDKTRKILWGRSGNRCAYCREELVFEKDQFNRHLNIGEECHIVSKSKKGPRNRIIEGFDYDGPDNLILLCCNHHTMIDEQVEVYSEDELIALKNSHEKWVTENLETRIETHDEQHKETKAASLISFITSKHDVEMNITSSKQIFQSSEGLALAFSEVANVKNLLNTLVADIQKSAPSYNVLLRDNPHHICDILFKGHSLLVQFYQAYGNSAENSYLLFAITNGTFTKDGRSDVFYPVTLQKIIRLDFSYNEDGEFGWVEQEKRKTFYTTKEITEIWVELFFKHVLK
jgi:hypothetical protein